MKKITGSILMLGGASLSFYLLFMGLGCQSTACYGYLNHPYLLSFVGGIDALILGAIVISLD